MSNSSPQSLKNHTRLDPLYHYILTPILLVNLVAAIIFLARYHNLHTVWLTVLSVALCILGILVRTYPLKVQDRVIRLEEQLRLQALAPVEWHAQIMQLRVDQLVGLRFASDEEVVSLAQQTLAENLNRKQIKERIQNWRPDNWRV